MKKYSKKKPLNSYCCEKANPLENIQAQKRNYKNLESDWREKLVALTDEQKKDKMLLYSTQGNKKLVKILYETMQEPTLDFTFAGDNCLTLAARSGDFQTVKYLVEQGIDIDFVGADGKTALQTYAFKGMVHHCKFLLDHFANPDTKGFMEETALFGAVINNQPEIIKLLNEYYTNLNIKNKQGIAPLMIACQNKNRQESLLTLLKLGADIEVEDFENKRPLSYAIKSNNRQFIDILLKRKCELNYQDANGVSPLMLAAKYGQKETLRVLLTKGADIYLQDNNGKTALDYAVDFDHPGSVDILGKAKRVLEQGDKDLSFFGKQNRVTNSCVK